MENKKVLGAYISEERIKKFEKVCEEKNLQKSKVINSLIEQFLENK